MDYKFTQIYCENSKYRVAIGESFYRIPIESGISKELATQLARDFVENDVTFFINDHYSDYDNIGVVVQFDFDDNKIDPQLIQAIDQGIIKLRIQLLIHRLVANKYNHGLNIDANNFPSIVRELPVNGQDLGHNPKLMVRPEGTSLSSEGSFHIDLTSDMLLSHSVELYPSRDKVLCAMYYRCSDNYLWTRKGKKPPIMSVAAELYVPALGKGTSDIFQYEREGTKLITEISSIEI